MTRAERSAAKIKLWFFRDLDGEDRRKLFSLFGMTLDEIGTMGHEAIALKHVLGELSPTPVSASYEAMKAALTAARPIIEGLISAEYNVETWGLRQRLAAIDAALAGGQP